MVLGGGPGGFSVSISRGLLALILFEQITGNGSGSEDFNCMGHESSSRFPASDMINFDLCSLHIK